MSAEWKPLAGKRFFLAPVDYGIAIGTNKASVASMRALIAALGGECTETRKGATVLGPKKPAAGGWSAEKLYETVRLEREVSERWLRDRGRYDAHLRAYGEAIGGVPLFEGMNLSGLDLSGLYLCVEGASDLDLSGANLGSVIFRWLNSWEQEDDSTLVRLERARFAGASFSHSWFENLHLVDADFREATFAGSTFKHCRIERPLFSGAALDGVRFDACTFVPGFSLGGATVSACEGLPASDEAREETRRAPSEDASATTDATWKTGDPTLLRALVEQPDDVDLWRRYAKSLLEIAPWQARVLLLAAKPESAQWNSPEYNEWSSALGEHARAWLGPLGRWPESKFEARWYRPGFVRRALVGATGLEALRELVEHPASVLLDRVYLRAPKLAQCVELLAKRPVSVVCLDAPKLVDLAPLARLPKLRALHIGNGKSVDLTTLAKLPGLAHLTLHNTPMESWSVLSKLGALETLHLADVALPQTGTLPKWPALEWIRLSGASIERCPVLARPSVRDRVRHASMDMLATRRFWDT